MSENENEVTALVLAVNAALVAPAGTVTLAGTLTRVVLLLDSVTTAPPAGAGVPRITVPVEGLPPMTVLRGFVAHPRRISRAQYVSLSGLSCGSSGS
jgi:hypothetical protein